MRGSLCHMSLSQHRRTTASLRLPEYQRGIVWTPEQVLTMIDSAERGYPLGMLMIWEVLEEGVLKQYVLDGQQRLAALTGRRAGETKTTWDVWYDMDKQGWVLGQPPRGFPLWSDQSPMDEIRHKEAAGIFTDPHGREALGRLDKVQYCCNFPVFLLQGGDTQDVLEMFRRINTGGTPLDPQLITWLQETARKDTP